MDSVLQNLFVQLFETLRSFVYLFFLNIFFRFYFFLIFGLANRNRKMKSSVNRLLDENKNGQKFK